MGEDEVRRRSRAMADGLAAASTVPGSRGDLTDMRRRAAQQAGYGDYWAGKCVGLIDRLGAERMGVQAGIEQMWKDHQCQRPDLEDIVRDLVRDLASEDIIDGEYGCVFCRRFKPQDHRPECPWRRAVEWTRTQETNE